jgi:hypothetical protein
VPKPCFPYNKIKARQKTFSSQARTGDIFISFQQGVFLQRQEYPLFNRPASSETVWDAPHSLDARFICFLSQYVLIFK